MASTSHASPKGPQDLLPDVQKKSEGLSGVTPPPPERTIISSISDKGRKLLERLEGFKKFLYEDGMTATGDPLWSIGYGHQVSKDDKVLALLGINQSQLHKGITQEQGDAILNEDLKIFSIQDLVKVPLFQYEYDGLSCFCYNLGHVQFSKTMALKEVNAKEYFKVPDGMGRFTNFSGKFFLPMAKRRCIEIMVYLEHSFDPRTLPSKALNLPLPDVDKDWQRLSLERRLDAVQMYRFYKGS